MSRPGTQVLAYRMTYSAKAPTAMLLPLPVALPARESAVRFKNLKQYPDFFKGLDSAFPPPEQGGFFRSKSAGLSAASAVPKPWSGVLTVAGIGWLLARRMKLRKR